MLSENEITKIRNWYKNNQLFAYIGYKNIVDLLNRILQVDGK